MMQYALNKMSTSLTALRFKLQVERPSTPPSDANPPEKAGPPFRVHTPVDQWASRTFNHIFMTKHFAKSRRKHEKVRKCGI